MEKCSVKTCEAPGNGSRGLCHAHYRRLLDHGDVRADIPIAKKAPGKECSIEGCGRQAKTRRMCKGHYHRWWKTGDAGPADFALRGAQCSIEECTNDASGGRGWCHTHYERWRRTGTPTPGPRRPQGHKRLNSIGYVLIHSDGCAPIETEHRLMWEARYGTLLPGQNIHHKNGDRADNRYENLELWDTTQPAGQRPEDKVEFAIEMLRRYAPERLA